MTDTKIILVQKELGGLGFNDPRTLELVQQAQDANAADKQLTIKEALKKYKKAVFWAFLLSVSLIMEGYDLVMVSFFIPL
jgi:SP family general alpha glucoside:H+ symporter-like MFS transporter